MYKKMLFCIMAAMLIVSTSASAKLVAHYKLDETEGTEAFDSVPDVGLSPAGQISGGVTLGEAGVPKLGGTCFHFPGSGEVLFHADGTVASDVNPAGPFTLTMWANTAYVGNTSFYTTQGANVAATGNGWVIKEQKDGFRVFFDTADADQASPSGVPDILPDDINKWWFIWLRYDGDSVQFGALLDNGAGIDAAGIGASQVWDNDAVGGPMELSTAPVLIGNGLNAYIDDVRFYDNSLADADLADIYSNVPSRANTPDPADGAMNVPTNTDLSWNAGQVFDMTDPNNPVVLRNPEVTAHYVYIQEAELGTAEPNELLYLGPVTVTDTGTDPLVLDNASLPLTPQLDKVYFWRVDEAINGSMAANDANTITGPTWSFESPRTPPVITADPARVAVFPSESAEFTCQFTSVKTVVSTKWYQDGAYYADGVLSGPDPNGLYTSTLSIASVVSGDEGDFACEVTNTSDVRTSAEAALLIKEQKAYWQFDGDFTDTLGNMDLTVPADANAPTFVTGLLPTSQPGGSAIKTDPNNAEYLTTTLAEPLDWFAGYTFTLWALAPSETVNGTQGVLSTSSTEATFQIDKNEPWRYNGTPGTQSLGPVVDSERVFLAISYDGTATTCYFNGVQAGEPLAQNDGIQIIDAIQIATRDDAFPYHFDGIIDDIQVFNYPLSQEQIIDIMVAETDAGVCDVQYAKEADIAGGGENGDEPDCEVNLLDVAAMANIWLDCVLIPSSYCP